MKNKIHTYLLNRAAFIVLTLLILIFSSGICLAVSGKSTNVKQQANPIILDKCKSDLAKRLNLSVKDVYLKNTESVTWPDASLGISEAGKMYAQVKTPGYRIILSVHNQPYLYTTSNKSYKYGGPMQIWSYSMLYLQPIPNEPNLNGDLYQCSLLGTNNYRLASGVSDYYPQDKGAVIFKRRMSRSGHDLIYVSAGEPDKAKLLYRGMDFICAALNNSHDRWAAVVRPRLGLDWTVVVGKMDHAESNVRTLALHDGIKPDKIAWSDDKLMIQVSNGKSSVAYEITPSDEKPEWKKVGMFYYPGQNKYMLNRSVTLEITENQENSKAGFEVTKVWFTGNRNVVAKVNNFVMRGYDLLGPIAFVWGESNGHSAAYSIEINSGSSVENVVEKGSNIRPFDCPPHNSPVPAAASKK